ncbi:hypothetical protein [Streptomyces sp. NPDC089799]|uniref:hypothetical protein n=1 Tax=Streptomyces sp. NPDC089799 TaxID=3155066 RepID=UPI00341F6859
MENIPAIVVGPPDCIGLRKVVIDGKSAGAVWSLHELHDLLRHAGVEPGNGIQWLGGDDTVWPDRPWRRRITGILMAVGLLVTARICLVIGKRDTIDALTFAGRATGLIFLIMGAAELLATVAACDYWRKRKRKYSGPILLLGVLVALLVGLLLLYMHIISQPYTHYMLRWIALTVLSAWALWILVRNRAWEGLRNPWRVALGAVVSTLIVIANLAYTQIYVPSVTSPIVQTSAEFGTPSLGRDGTTMYVPVRLNIRNTGEVPVYILGSMYWIRGIGNVVSPSSADTVLIQPGEFIRPPGRSLNPKEDFSEDVVARIPSSGDLKFEAIAAQVEAYVVRKDRLKMSEDYGDSGKWRSELKAKGEDKDPPGPDSEYRRYQSRFSNSSELLNVTRGRERVTLWWVLRGNTRPPGPYLDVDVSLPGEKETYDLHDAATRKRAEELYGLQLIPGSIAEIPYAGLLKAAQGQRPN